MSPPASRGVVVVLSGPSGVGKTTVVQGLLALPGYERSVTATTRPARAGEKPGVDYLFLAREEFEKGIRAGRFLEHATVHGQLYGTPRDGVEAVLARGGACLLNIDVQGADSLRRSGLPVVTVFVLPPSLEELERRLAKRGTEDPAEVARRLDVARREIADAGRFDLRVVNREVAEAVREISAFVASKR